MFSNGSGDGGFPLIVGYDGAGKAVALVTWSFAAPWRQAFEQGSPPPQIAAIEEHIKRCLAGGGRADSGGNCRS